MFIIASISAQAIVQILRCFGLQVLSFGGNRVNQRLDNKTPPIGLPGLTFSTSFNQSMNMARQYNRARQQRDQLVSFLTAIDELYTIVERQGHLIASMAQTIEDLWTAIKTMKATKAMKAKRPVKAMRTTMSAMKALKATKATKAMTAKKAMHAMRTSK